MLYILNADIKYQTDNGALLNWKEYVPQFKKNWWELTEIKNNKVLEITWYKNYVLWL